MSLSEAHDKLRFSRITTRNADGRPVLNADLPNYEEYDPIITLCEYEDTRLSPSQIDKLFPHVCANCIGCEVAPVDGHGCDEHDSFVLSVERGYNHLLKIVEEEQEALRKKIELMSNEGWLQTYDTCITKCGCGNIGPDGKIRCWNTLGCEYGVLSDPSAD